MLVRPRVSEASVRARIIVSFRDHHSSTFGRSRRDNHYLTERALREPAVAAAPKINGRDERIRRGQPATYMQSRTRAQHIAIKRA